MLQESELDSDLKCSSRSRPLRFTCAPGYTVFLKISKITWLSMRIWQCTSEFFIPGHKIGEPNSHIPIGMNYLILRERIDSLHLIQTFWIADVYYLRNPVFRDAPRSLGQLSASLFIKKFPAFRPLHFIGKSPLICPFIVYILGSGYSHWSLKMVTLTLTHFLCHSWPHWTQGLSSMLLDNEGMVLNLKQTLCDFFKFVLKNIKPI